MFDDFNSESGVRNDGRARDRQRDDARNLFEREVPLGQTGETSLAIAVHAWLDGELPESVLRRGDSARDVDFWNRLGEETSARRHMRTPTHIQDRIMEALPQHAPQLITPWFQRELVLTPASAVAIGSALVAVTAAATAAFMGVIR
ncbi:MAG: hypothetical protein JWO05_1596 [Gemmatimonadetes bacterium]|nr:hypothetical protein [Gemmatimonadota bacterium]